MSDNWIVQNLINALNTWNEKLSEIWSLLTTTVSYEEIALEETTETVAAQEPAEAVEATNEAAEYTEKSTPVVPIVIGVLVVAAAGGAAVAVSKKKSQK